MGHEADGYVRVAGQFADTGTYQQRGVVTGITVVQATCWQVEDSDKEGDEHVSFVHVGYRLVHRSHDAVGHRLVGRHGTEGRACYRHEERGRHTLARHVADAEEELLVAEVEVEEVAAHLLGRSQRGKELHVVAVLPGGELLGQHTHLYLAGDAQVTLYRCFLGRRVLQFLDVSHQRLLHIPERLRQLSYLVDTFEVGQLSVKLSGGYRLGTLGQLSERPQLAGNDADEEEEHQQQTADDNGHNRTTQTVEAAEDVVLGTDDSH